MAFFILSVVFPRTSSPFGLELVFKLFLFRICCLIFQTFLNTFVCPFASIYLTVVLAFISFTRNHITDQVKLLSKYTGTIKFVFLILIVFLIWFFFTVPWQSIFLEKLLWAGCEFWLSFIVAVVSFFNVCKGKNYCKSDKYYICLPFLSFAFIAYLLTPWSPQISTVLPFKPSFP